MTTVTNLDADVDFICNSTSASYPTSAKRRNMNLEYHNVARICWESDGTWNYDDSNNTTTPIAYRTIANASANYLIPTTAIRIEEVEIKDNTGTWYRLNPINLTDMAVAPDSYLTGTGLPIQYWLEGNEIRLFPAPGTGYVTMSSGLAVRLSRSVTELAVTATTSEPGFATPFHRILSLAASIDFIQDEGQRNFLIMQRDRLTKGLTTFYSKRADEYKTRISPAGRRRQRQYQ